MTDKQKINKFFANLRSAGYFARQCLGDCNTCGLELVPQGTKKFVFYHKQANEAFQNTGVLYLNWQGKGKEIVEFANSNDLFVKWNGSEDQKIGVKA